MLDIRFRPLPKWTETIALAGINGQFRMPFNRSLDLLESELNKLGAHDIVAEAGFRLNQICNDGWPFSGQTPSHPGVVLYFKSAEGEALRFACGTYKTWKQNIHAIALTLEALRAVSRYGATPGNQQYLGFRALAAPAGAPSGWTVDSAAEWLSLRCGNDPQILLTNKTAYRTAYRKLAARWHADGSAPDAAQWAALQHVAALLDQHHKEKAGHANPT